MLTGAAARAIILAVVAQPSGTVTLVFTDVEGSTRLLEKLGRERYREALAAHRKQVREAFTRYGGYEVDFEGDSFFYAFASAADAASAVGEAMGALRDGPISVRVGIHTGEPGLDPPKYVGIDVHRAARIMACAHGGQVVLSQSTRDLLDVDVPLLDLGDHRLKDLSSPLRLYQLGDREFPPLRSLYRTNLPVPATAFVGRERELSEVVTLLERDDVRLLTLTGPGGTGKTRLALQAAAEAAELFPDGVWWVPLAALRDPALVLSSVAAAVAVKEQPGRPLRATLADQLTGKRLLILLDNAEHLLPGAASGIAALGDILGSKLVVTSRERLELAGEHSYPVPGLADEDAAALFTARASQVEPSFEATFAVAEVCARLDNLPLAIELAAARTSLFSADELLTRLGECLDLFRGARDADPRQQTLRATIDWSYRLLASEEQRVYRGLSVFAGGCTLAAAEAVCGAGPDAVESLLAKSLLRRRRTDVGSRYWMLETVRQHANEQLREAGESAEIEERQLEWFVTLAEQAEPELRRWLREPWLGRIEAERDNVRAVLQRAVSSGWHEVIATIGADLVWAWVWQGGLNETWRWLECALDRVEDYEPTLQARLLLAGAVCSSQQGEYARCRDLAERALLVCEALGDTERYAFTINGLGFAAAGLGEMDRARSLWEQARALAREHGFRRLIGVTSANLGDLALFDGRIAEGRELSEEAVRRFEEIGTPTEAWARINLGYAAMLERREATAREIYRDCVDRSRERGDQVPGSVALIGLAWALASEGNVEEAARLLAAAEGLLAATGVSPHWMGNAMREGARECIRRHLDEDVLEDLLAEGGEMSFEGAAAYAVAERGRADKPVESG